MSEQSVLFPESSPDVHAKKCTKCGEMKPASAFTRAASHRDGLASHCRACVRAKRQENWSEWYSQHRDELLAAKKTRYYAHHDEVLAKARAESTVYRAAHKDEIRERQAARRAALGVIPRPPPSPPGTKRCWGCKQTLLVADFAKNRAQPSGVGGVCRSCRSAQKKAARLKDRDATRANDRAKYLRTREQSLARGRVYRATHIIEERDRVCRRKYGITYAEYTRMLAAQGGRCAICGRPPGLRRLSVDHDHATGAVRGLLCGHCNTSLGRMGDDAALLRKAADYLDSRRGDK